MKKFRVETDSGYIEFSNEKAARALAKGKDFITIEEPENVDESYIANRKNAYPPIGDQLDAIWKEINYRRLNGQQIVQEADDILNRILAVKAEFPKPGKK